MYRGGGIIELFPQEVETLQEIEFKRITEIVPKKELKLFKGIEPNDVCQGSLGNCYYLSALAAIAEFARERRIEKMFLHEEANPQQVYAVRMYINGIERIIIVDNYLPVYRGTSEIAFSKCLSGEMWVPILEKAWAKANGSYDWTIGGFTKEALRCLTGAPT